MNMKMKVDDLIAEIEENKSPWRLDWSKDYQYKVIQAAIQVVQSHDSDTIHFEDIVFLFADRRVLKRANHDDNNPDWYWLLDDAEFIATDAFENFWK